MIHVLQGPGETLYLPYGYVHAVYNLDDCIGVTANYAAPHEENRYEIWHAVSVEGTVQHKRQFFYGKLTSDQRRELRSHRREEVSEHLQLPTLLLDGIEKVEISYQKEPTITVVFVGLLLMLVLGLVGSVAVLLLPPTSKTQKTSRTAGSNKTIRVTVTKRVDAKGGRKKKD